MDVWLLDLRGAGWGSEGLHALLSPDEVERASRFVRRQDGECFVAARAALRTLLARYTGRPADSLEFEYGEQGKPRLSSRCGPVAGQLHFNLSHSGGLGLVAVTRLARVGADLEEARPLPELEGMARRVLTDDERFLLERVPRTDEVFLDLWVQKEALLKGTGEGLSRAPGSFRVPFLGSPAGRPWRIPGEKGGDERWVFFLLPLAPRVHGAVAVEWPVRAPRPALRILRWTPPLAREA